jgi:hypothetical protein
MTRAAHVDSNQPPFGLPRFEVAARAPETALGLQIIGLWPAIVWMVQRTRDGSDEPWGLVALTALLVVAALSRKRATRQASPSAAVATLGYALCLPWLSPLPCALVGLFAVALSLSRYLCGRTLSFGILGLCWLSVPLLASLDFYLGYPLRWVTAEAATWLLQAGGIAAQRSGVNLFVLGRSKGPWHSVTIAETAQPSDTNADTEPGIHD